MVCDFITERNGYLALKEDEYQMAKQVDPTIRRYAQQSMVKQKKDTGRLRSYGSNQTGSEDC